MKYVHLYSGTDGKSHFEDVEVPLTLGRPQEESSAPIKATGVLFRITGGGYDLDWHNPPRRQFVITLEGEVEITASDGTKRRFGPGDIMLADDIKGQGHLTQGLSQKPRRAVVVTLE
ncbi:MAG: hypothetical protein V1894_02095 [Chloroflexota bacterium]